MTALASDRLRQMFAFLDGLKSDIPMLLLCHDRVSLSGFSLTSVFTPHLTAVQQVERDSNVHAVCNAEGCEARLIVSKNSRTSPQALQVVECVFRVSSCEAAINN